MSDLVVEALTEDDYTLVPYSGFVGREIIEIGGPKHYQRPARFGDIMKFPNRIVNTAGVTIGLNVVNGWDLQGPVNYFSQLAGKASVNGVFTQYTPAPLNGVLDTAGNGVYKPWDMEFVLTGDYCLVGWDQITASDAKLFVNGQPCMAEPQVFQAGSSCFQLQFAAPNVYDIRVVGNQTLSYIATNRNGTVHAPQKKFILGVTGDSYVEPMFWNFSESLAPSLATETGFQTYNFGQGGTGYTNNGVAAGVGTNTSIYGSVDRIARYAAAPLDALLINGGANDIAATVQEVYLAAKKCYADIGVARPDLPLIVVGVEPNSYFRGAAAAARNDVIRQAAAEAYNVVGFIDPYAEAWHTGNGSDNSVNYSGNQDYTVSGYDGIHPSKIGHRLYARLIADRMFNIPLQIERLAA